MINYNDFYLTADQADEITEDGGKCYVVFEEDDASKPKSYDLTHGIFKDLEIARSFVGKNNGTQKLYIADYGAYVSGNYDYL